MYAPSLEINSVIRTISLLPIQFILDALCDYVCVSPEHESLKPRSDSVSRLKRSYMYFLPEQGVEKPRDGGRSDPDQVTVRTRTDPNSKL